jgi:glycosyltransferase involved in cell wall biosynthesis
MDGPLPASRRLDLLALAPLPCRLDGAVALQVGGSLQCAWLVEGLAQLGHRVRVLSVGPVQPSRMEPGDPPPGVEVDWFAVEKLHTATPPPADAVARRRADFERALDRALAERRPDLVLLGNEGHPWYAAEPCRERGLRTVLIAQGVPTAGIPNGIYPPDALATFTGRLAAVDGVVAVSRHLEAVLSGLGLDRVTTIETATDTDAFRPRKPDPELLTAHDIEPGRFVVGSFVHMRPEKRIEDIVRSAELVVRSRPDALYLLAGEGRDREAIERLVAELGLGANVRLLGELDHRRVPAYMNLCDAVVLASEREGYSLVCREAQASGCALLATDIPAGRAATAGGSGLLFALGDVEDLAAKTLELAGDEALRRSICERGRAAVVENGSGDWIEAWSELLTEAARGEPAWR